MSMIEVNNLVKQYKGAKAPSVASYIERPAMSIGERSADLFHKV